MRPTIPAIPAYLAFAAIAFKRQFAYRLANWSGLFTNTFFLFFRAYSLGAAFTGRSSVGSLSAAQVTTYATVTQALLMVAPMWGVSGLAASVRSGQIAVELSRPLNYFLMHMSQRLGTSAYHVFARFVPVMTVGLLAGFLSAPARPELLPAIALSVLLGAWIAHCILFLIELSSFWLESERGVRSIMMGVTAMCSGLIVPLHFFPGWAFALVDVLPFRYISYLTTELYMDRRVDGSILIGFAGQIAWAATLTLLCQWALALGRRKLVIHGG